MAEQTGDRKLSYFESLPGEMLNRIYRYAVVEEGMVIAATRNDGDGTWKSNEPALARVCRQFRREVLPIYYVENTFTFPIAKVASRSEGHSNSLRKDRKAVNAWVDAIGSWSAWIVRVGFSSQQRIRYLPPFDKADLVEVVATLPVSKYPRKVDIVVKGPKGMEHKIQVKEDWPGEALARLGRPIDSAMTTCVSMSKHITQSRELREKWMEVVSSLLKNS